MAEVQRNRVNAGETTQRFISFLIRQSQQAALCLGQIPHPQTGKAEAHPEIAKLFIEDLEMIREKTRGNLSGEEIKILDDILANLQCEYAKVVSQ
ncbi:MAG TPA: DUF1844 domain-containing protein [Chthoniobacterales bacterium]